MQFDVTLEMADGRRHDVSLHAPATTSSAEIAVELRRIFGVPGTRGLFVDGSPFDETSDWTRQFADGAIVRTEPQETAPQATARLVVAAGPDAGLVCDLSGRTITVGRGGDCDVVLDDPDVSRLHASLTAERNGLRIDDLGSTNGLWIEGERLTRTGMLEPEQAVRLGNTVLRLDTGFRQAATPGPSRITWPSAPESASLPSLPLTSLVASAGAAVAVGSMTHSVRFLLLSMLAPLILLGAALVNRLRMLVARRHHLHDHEAAVAAATDQVAAAIRSETLRRRATLPDPLALAERLERYAPVPAASALSCRIGIANLPSEVIVSCGTTSASAGTAPLVPIAIDPTAGVLRISGPRHAAVGLARWLLAQWCAHSSRHDGEAHLVLDEDREGDWTWARWLPQLPTGGPARTPRRSAAHGCRERIVIVDVDADDTPDDAFESTFPGAFVVVVGGQDRALGSRISISVNERLEIRTPELEASDVIRDGITSELAERIARRIAAARPDGGRRRHIADVRLLSHVSDRDTKAITRSWVAGPSGASALIGVEGREPFEIDLCSDGPHGLIVGTTGSGKSELLQTLVASLSLRCPPDELSFVLIDYKGGATFGPCSDLPHVSCVMTDLDMPATARTLTALEAELRRREEVLAELGVASFDAIARHQCPAVMPRLVVVVDEFAALVDGHAELADSLVAVAQRGRSLGLHLVLATQRAASVSPDIRANVDLRIALRMADQAESRDLLGVPDAAEIAPDERGVAIARTASGLHRVRVARVSCPVERPGVHLAPLGAWRSRSPTPGDGGRTDLMALTEILRAATESLDLAGHPPPWKRSLPTTLWTSELPDEGSPEVVPFALADLPSEQRQEVVSVDLAEGAALSIVGGPRSGRTTALATIARSAAARLPPSQLAIYVVDAAGGTLATHLDGAPHVGTIATIDDLDQVSRLVARLGIELRTRPTAGAADSERAAAADHALILIDGRDRLDRILDAFDNGATSHALNDLVALGPGRGMSVVVSGEHDGNVARAVSFSNGIVLGGRSATSVGRFTAMSSHVPDLAGRGIRSSDGTQVQVALHADNAPLRTDGPETRSPPRVVVRRLPASVTLEEISVPSGSFALGVGGDEATVIAVDLVRHSARLLITGPPNSGKSTTLISLLHQGLAMGTPICVAAHDGSPLAVAAHELGANAISPWENHPPIDCADGLLLIDDVDRFVDVPAEDAIVAIMRSSHQRCSVVASGDATSISLTRRGAVAQLRQTRTGLLLQPRPIDGELVGVRLQQLRATIVPGRGLLVPDPRWTKLGASREPIPIQVAVPASHTYPMCG